MTESTPETPVAPHPHIVFERTPFGVDIDGATYVHVGEEWVPFMMDDAQEVLYGLKSGSEPLQRVAHLLRSATKVRVDRPHEAIRNFANQTLARHAKDGELSLTIEGTAEEIDFLLRFIGGAES